MLNEAEGRVIQHLADAWNAYLELPVDHQDAQGEFRHGIHALQAIVFARPAVRAWNAASAPRPTPSPLPDGYSWLPEGQRCRCIGLWSDGESRLACCNRHRPVRPPAPSDCHGLGHTGCGQWQVCRA